MFGDDYFVLLGIMAASQRLHWKAEEPVKKGQAAVQEKDDEDMNQTARTGINWDGESQPQILPSGLDSLERHVIFI